MSADGFETVWSKTIDGIARTRSAPRPSATLKPLLRGLYAEACRRPPVLPGLGTAIEQVLLFLASKEGRTHDNCWVTSNFLMPGNDFWEADWYDLPKRYVEILAAMGHELWQAVEDPEWTQNYAGLPEQLLARLKSLQGNHAG